MIFKLMTHFLIFLIFISKINSSIHDYEISRGRKMWQGIHRAVHYVDHFNLLTDKMEGIKGLLTTFIPLIGGNDWSLSFEINVFGEMNSLKDGIFLGLSKEKFNTFELDDKNKNKSDFVKIMPKKIGFFMYLNGKNDNQLRTGFKKNKKKYSKKDYNKCNIDFGKGKVLFFIKGGAGKIVVSYHYEDEDHYTKCVDVQHKDINLSRFYPIFFARSVKGSKFRVKLSAMTFSSHVDNPSISENEAKFDEHLPKLFKHIAFLKKNSDYLNTFKKEVKDENLNIPELFDSQLRVFNSINYSNILLSQCLSETDVILDYTKRQNDSTKEFGHMVINTIQTWMDKTAEQYKAMDEDVDSILKEMKEFNFDTLVDQTKNLLADFNKKMNEQPNSLKEYKKFGKLVKKNLEELRKKKAVMNDFPQFIEKFLKNRKTESGNTLNITLSSLMGFLGFITILILCFIMYKLGSKKTSF